MKHEMDYSDLFDDDFEVTYEGGWESTESSPDITYSRDTDIPSDGEPDDRPTHDIDVRRVRRGSDARRGGIYEYEEEALPSRRGVRRGVPLAAPIRRGGRVLSRAAAALVRCFTAVLILATTAYVTYTFWRASTPYGDIAGSMRAQKLSLTLAAYLCVAVIFLLFEFIVLLWSMTRVRVRDESGYRKEDAGRGLSSFLLVFASSYAAFLLYRFLPESPEILYGLKGALEVYGSMHNVLFGLCAAGVISCLVRKYFSH